MIFHSPAVEHLETRALLSAAALAQIRQPEAAAFVLQVGSSRQQVVAVLDTGLGLRSIPAANLWINPGEVARDGLDNDGNGFVDDVSGWNFSLNTADVTDRQGHGSRVASEIVLIDPQVLILPVKLGDGAWGGREIRDAISYVEAFARAGVPIVAGNMSFGGGAYDPAMAGLLDAASVIWVASAGNYGTRLSPEQRYYPAHYSNVISVAANVTGSDSRAGYSNWGQVTVSAPGKWTVKNSRGAATGFTGTSAAAPAVTGIVSLVARVDHDADDVLSAILDTARPNSFTRHGLVDALAAVHLAHARSRA